MISPDLGDKYIDTVFNDDWAAERFPELGPGKSPGAGDERMPVGSTWRAGAAEGRRALSK